MSTSGPNESLIPETPEGFLESFALKRELNELFDGLKQIGEQRDSEQRITFNTLRENVHLIGSLEGNLLHALDTYEQFFYTNPGIGLEFSFAEKAVRHIYRGRRPTLNDFEEMDMAWSAAEEREIPHIIARTISDKYDQNSANQSEAVVELDNGSDIFEGPVREALEGNSVTVKNIALEANENIDDRDRGGYWYRVTDIEFETLE